METIFQREFKKIGYKFEVKKSLVEPNKIFLAWENQDGDIFQGIVNAEHLIQIINGRLTTDERDRIYQVFLDNHLHSYYDFFVVDNA